MLLKKRPDTCIDFISAGLFLLVFIVIVKAFQYHLVFGESDLYRVLIGMIDGAVTGSGLRSNLHYGRDFGFGYILALYALTPVQVLSDPDKLIALINNIGFYFAIAGLILLWLSVLLVHGSCAALVALAIFAFSPMVLELATSGHQILTSIAFLWAAAVCLFWPLTGWRAVLAAIAGTILLICGLCIRAEIFLALPYLVLARVNLTSWRVFLKSAAINVLAPSTAFVTFLGLRQAIAVFPRRAVETTRSETIVEQFFSVWNAGPGIVYMVLGCGIATVLFAAGVGAWVIIKSIRSTAPAETKAALEQLMGPVALILVPLPFWLLDGPPSRHFILPLAGISILIGWAISNLPALHFVPALAAVLGLIVANQVLSEAVRPALLRMNAARSAYRLAPEYYTTFTMAPLGWSWQHHAALDARWHQWNALGNMATTSCDANTVIFSDNTEQIISRFYAAGWRSDQSSLILIHGFVALTGNLGAHHYVFVVKTTGWPKDAVAEVLADRSFDDYKLYADPYLSSVYDKMAIPDTRLARFGC